MACEDKLDESLTGFSVGECIQGSADSLDGVEIESAEHISCDTPGALRVAAVFDVPGGDDWPGADAMDQAALEGCPGDSVTYLAPTEESWEKAEDREIVCLAEA